MSRAELFAAISEHGYSEPAFIEDLAEDRATVKNLLRLMKAGKTEKA